MLNRVGFGGCIFIVFLFSCRNIEEPTAYGQEYFPLSVGSVWVYEVDSIVYDDFSDKDSAIFHFFKKEEITSSFEPLEGGGTTFIVDVLHRRDSTASWKYVKSIHKSLDTYRAYATEHNVKRVPLVFPIKDRKSWDPNQLNTLDEQRYRYLQVGNSASVFGKSYESSIYVEQEVDSNFFQTIKKWERYAPNVGLIEKRFNYIEATEKGDVGVKYYWQLTSFKS
ncbi:MAG: hypothetical protein ACI8ZN_001585 [Bacteroidia bacterium]|jgi:hypothetical protein